MEEEFSGTETENAAKTSEFSQDESDDVEVEALEVEASGRGYEK